MTGGEGSVHQCDASVVPGGGLLTLHRTLRAVIDVMNNQTPAVIAEVDDCPRCRLLLSLNLASWTAAAFLEHNPDSRMGYEMTLSAVQSALDRGETETTPGGF